MWSAEDLNEPSQGWVRRFWFRFEPPNFLSSDVLIVDEDLRRLSLKGPRPLMRLRKHVVEIWAFALHLRKGAYAGRHKQKSRNCRRNEQARAEESRDP